MAAQALHVEWIGGEKDAPVLVFLHHGLGSIGQWRDFPRELAQATGLSALVYDRCGHGQSPACDGERTPRYMHREAEVLRDLLRSRGVADFILIGHSDGGSIALLYAALPDVVAPRGIIAESAHVFVEDVTRQGIRVAVDAYVGGMRERLRKYHGANTERMFWDWAGTWLAPSFDSWNLCEDIQAVPCPVAVVQGADDEYGTEAQVEAILGAVRYPSGKHLIVGAAHEPHHQAREATLATMRLAVERFIRS